MKRTLSILLALLLVFALLPVLAQSARAEAGAQPESQAPVPDDAFDGDFADFEGSDGSVTSVYDSGSVVTVFPDGTVVGVDYLGNEHSRSADGTYNVRTADGSVYTNHPDGRQAVYEPKNCKTTTFYPDGHLTEEYPSLDLVVEYNSDYEKTGMGFIGGTERLAYDEHGCAVNGTISGPNGATLTVTDDGMRMVNSGGKTVELSYSDGSETCVITAPNGASLTQTVTTRWEKGEDGAMVKVKDTEGTMLYPDGLRYDCSESITYDKDGNPVISTKNVGQWTDTDSGATLWFDGNSDAVEFNDPRSGDRYSADASGRLTSLHDGTVDLDMRYDEKGGVVSGSLSYSDGTRIKVEPDGSGSVVTADGTEYRSDGRGNVWRNGELIREGEPLGPTAEELAGSYDNGTIVIEAVDVPQELLDAMQAGGEDGEEGCDIDPNELVGQSNEFPFTLAVAGENELTFSTESFSQTVRYDPATGELSAPPFNVSEDGSEAVVTLSLRCEYADEARSAIHIGGSLIEEFLGEYKGVRVVAALTADRQLG